MIESLIQNLNGEITITQNEPYKPQANTIFHSIIYLDWVDLTLVAFVKLSQFY
jgi:hypothetical protein